MKNTAITKEQAKATAHDSASTDSELYKLGTFITAAFAGAVGVWSLICLSSALISGGGPITLVKSMFSAIVGS
ncbi:MAG: hypothetical protein KJ990_09595 [Proteobacteria bacterium]|nr:hypothetical protein [Pseudomonadota bacterium]MBU1648073.1 hypothetical protein [Pseudomonadota bacterium]